MPNPSHRSLLQALAVSLLVHAVLLSRAFAPEPVAPGRPAAALNARIVAPPQSVRPGTAPRSTGAVVAAPAPALPASPVAAARPADPPPVIAAAPAASTPAAPSASAPAPLKAAPREGGASPPAPGHPARSGGAASAAAPDAVAEGVAADDLRQYRLSLATTARRFKGYPALARQRGWEGTVEVALDFSALAPLPQVLLLRSSGHAALDAQALDMLSRATAVTALPDGLKARAFRVVLPVQFSLDGEP